MLVYLVFHVFVIIGVRIINGLCSRRCLGGFGPGVIRGRGLCCRGGLRVRSGVGCGSGG